MCKCACACGVDGVDELCGEDEWKQAAVTDKYGEYIPFWKSTFADIEMLGTGIGLWFRTLKAMSLYFFVMSIPGCMILAHYLAGTVVHPVSHTTRVQVTGGPPC